MAGKLLLQIILMSFFAYKVYKTSSLKKKYLQVSMLILI